MSILTVEEARNATDVEYEQSCQELNQKWLGKLANLPPVECAYVAGVCCANLIRYGLAQEETVTNLMAEGDGLMFPKS